MLPILLWGCAGRDTIREGTAPSQAAGDGTTLALFILLPLFLLVGALLLICWMVMVRQRKALLLAEVSLHQQEVRSATLVFQLREASRRYKALQQRADVSQGGSPSGNPFPEEEDIPEI
ncbi:hypothetical protein HF324_03950 [Chitinophaga oryzae]|uniref:Uncharacterized protein n=1 Tax=Chitinophaga oryzae TaxID=2725414 RepID=A0AAE7D6C9_9BACT|nr:hypothetical protein [Chitinophaga oryzae]QJB30552.1 hypothetical protein HF329_04250 [Chitinophaga oryzae]QJB37051.1 hypothetical protein HF324_03950 [Chitinophaga oryzae]